MTKLAKDSTIEKLVRMVEEARTRQPDTQHLSTVPAILAVGVIFLTIALIVDPILFLKEPFQAAFYRAMTVMVVASPCALIISTPASILSAIGGATRHGGLFKGGVHLERAATVKVVALNETGTPEDYACFVPFICSWLRPSACRRRPAAGVRLWLTPAAAEAACVGVMN